MATSTHLQVYPRGTRYVSPTGVDPRGIYKVCSSYQTYRLDENRGVQSGHGENDIFYGARDPD